MIDINVLEGRIESLKLEEDWEHCEVPNVCCLYSIFKGGLRFVVYKGSYDNNSRLNVIGSKGKTQSFEGTPINQLYRALAERLGCDESGESLKKQRDEMYLRALERLAKKEFF